MPIVRIDLWEGRDSETRRELIRAVSEVVSERLGVSVDHVRVVLNEIPRENWGIGGEPASQQNPSQSIHRGDEQE